MVVGGMPAVVQNFVDSHDVAKSVQMQKDILSLYRQDIRKYSKNDKIRIKDIFDRKNLGELDFIVQKGNGTLALEIKSGKDYHRHAALDNVIVNKAWKLHQGLVFCIGNIETAGKNYILSIVYDSIPEAGRNAGKSCRSDRCFLISMLRLK